MLFSPPPVCADRFGFSPAGRLLALAVLAFSLALSHDLIIALIALIGALGLLAISEVRLGWALRRLVMVSGLLALLLFTLPLTTPGEPIDTLGLISREGLTLGLLIWLKGTALIALMLALAAPLGVMGVASGLRALGLGSRLSFLVLLAWRYLFVLESALRQMLTALRLRGFKAGFDRHTFRTLGYLMGELFLRADRQADRTLEALRLRGFDGTFRSLDGRTFGRRDLALITFVLALALWVHL